MQFLIDNISLTSKFVFFLKFTLILFNLLVFIQLFFAHTIYIYIPLTTLFLLDNSIFIITLYLLNNFILIQ